MMKRTATYDIPAEQLGHETAEMVQTIGFGSLQPAMQECIELAQKSIGVNFANAAAPHGEAWPPRKEIGDGHPLLIESGKLFQAATSDFGEGHVGEVRDRDAETGIDPGEVPYAAAQNFGLEKRNLTQREYEDVDDATIDQMLEIVADEVIELLL